MPRPTRYQPEQIDFLKAHYHQMSNAELAAALNIDSPRKVLDLARKHGVKWRAANGAPRWRQQPAPEVSPWPAGSRWAA